MNGPADTDRQAPAGDVQEAVQTTRQTARRELEAARNRAQRQHGRYVARLLKARAAGRFMLGSVLAVAGALAAAAPAAATDAQGQIAAPPAMSDGEVCLQNIRSQERQRRIPVGLLMAIGLTESGRTVDRGHRTVWPWTVNAAGEGHFFASKAEAVAFVADQQAKGVDSIDVGCMQINLKHHPDAFASLDDAFDPATNVAYGADFLAGLRAELDSWIGAARRYHSATPELGEAYGEIVIANWTGATKQQELKASAAGTAVAANMVPAQMLAALPVPAGIRATTDAGFLRAMPVRVAAGNLSLFAQFYNRPPPPAAASTSRSPAFVSFQKIFPRRTVPGQTGLTLQDYRIN